MSTVKDYKKFIQAENKKKCPTITGKKKAALKVLAESLGFKEPEKKAKPKKAVVKAPKKAPKKAPVKKAPVKKEPVKKEPEYVPVGLIKRPKRIKSLLRIEPEEEREIRLAKEEKEREIRLAKENKEREKKWAKFWKKNPNPTLLDINQFIFKGSDQLGRNFVKRMAYNELLEAWDQEVINSLSYIPQKPNENWYDWKERAEQILKDSGKKKTYERDYIRREYGV